MDDLKEIEIFFECEENMDTLDSGYYTDKSDCNQKDLKSQTQNYLLEIKQLKIENEILKQRITARDIELRNIESKNKENLKEKKELTDKCETLRIENQKFKDIFENTKKQINIANRRINEERSETEKKYNDKLKVLENMMTETLQNSEVNDKVITAQNINVEMIKSGKITALENIGKYFQNIERFEKNLQTKIFIKNVDPSVIILLGGKKKIKDLTLEEIKEKVFNQTQDISTMEIITELNKDSWKGNDPIILKITY